MSRISGLLLLSFFLMGCHPEEEKELLLMDETVQSFTTEYANRIVIDNMKQLKFVKVPEQNRKEVHMLGYYEPKDGGGGIFWWDRESTEKENGGTIIKAAGIEVGRWKRTVDKKTVSVLSFGAKAEVDFNSTKAFQAMADALGYVNIPLSKVPYEVESFVSTRTTVLNVVDGEAKIKLREPTVKNSPGFQFHHDNSGINAGVEIDGNFTSRTAVLLNADNCFANFSVKNITADLDSTTFVSGLLVTGDECYFDIYGENFLNTGQRNHSVPRLVTVQGTATGYKGRLKGKNLQVGLCTGAETGIGYISELDLTACVDNGLYQLGGEIEIEKMVYRGAEEAVVIKGSAEIGDLLVKGRGTRGVALQGGNKLSIQNYFLDREATDGMTSVIATRKEGFGDVFIENIEGELVGNTLIHLDTRRGQISSLVINSMRIKYYYDMKRSGSLYHFMNLTAVEKFILKDLKVDIIDVENVLTEEDIFAVRLPNVSQKSLLQDPEFEVYESDGKSFSPSSIRIVNFAQKLIEYSGLVIQGNVGPYGREFSYGAKSGINLLTEVPKTGEFVEGQKFYKKNSESGGEGWVVISTGVPGIFQAFSQD